MSIKDFIDSLNTNYCICCGAETEYYLCNRCRAAILYQRKELETSNKIAQMLKGVEYDVNCKGSGGSGPSNNT